MRSSTAWSADQLVVGGVHERRPPSCRLGTSSRWTPQAEQTASAVEEGRRGSAGGSSEGECTSFPAGREVRWCIAARWRLDSSMLASGSVDLIPDGELERKLADGRPSA